jgi:hypothetical protein
MGTSVRLLSQSFIFTLTNRVNRESFAPLAVIAFIAKAEAVLRFDFAVAVSYQILFTPPLACKEKGIPEQKYEGEVFSGASGMGMGAVFTPKDIGPSQPDLTQVARKILLSDRVTKSRLPSPIFRPETSYQNVKEGEQPVAFKEKGRPRQALTSFTAWTGATGSEVTFNVTSFEASTQDPNGRVEKREKAFNFAPCKEGVAIIESISAPLMVQRKVDTNGTLEFSQTVRAEMMGAFRNMIRTESE